MGLSLQLNASDKLFVGTEDGYLIGFDGMTRGMNNYYLGAGDTSISSVFLTTPVDNVKLMDFTGGNEIEVMVSTGSDSDYSVLIYDMSLNYLLGAIPMNQRISSFDAGSIGNLNRGIVIATNASINSRFCIYDQNLDLVDCDVVTIPIFDVILGDVSAAISGNEILLSANWGSRTTSRLLGYNLDYDSTAGYSIISLWPLSSWSPNNMISDLDIGDLYPSIAGEEFVMTGNSIESSGNTLGDGSQAYYWPGIEKRRPLDSRDIGWGSPQHSF